LFLAGLIDGAHAAAAEFSEDFDLGEMLGDSAGASGSEASGAKTVSWLVGLVASPGLTFMAMRHLGQSPCGASGASTAPHRGHFGFESVFVFIAQ
jgi:hypothetical protein